MINVIDKKFLEGIGKVLLIPKCKRAKERVALHGKIMLLLRQDPDGSILVESLNDTYRGEKWGGWFKRDEVDFQPVEEKDLNAG